VTATDRAIRWAAAAAVVVVAGIAAVVSYTHAYELVVTHGERGGIAKALPLTIDGLIVCAGLVILDCARQRRSPPVLAWILLVVGILATVGANVAHGAGHGWIGAAVAAWPAAVATGCFEMSMRLIRGARAADEQPEFIPADMPDDSAPDPVLATARERFAEQLADGAVPSVRAIKRELKVGHPRARRIRAVLAEQEV
jgi:uncharacterized protein DUF2637